MQHIGISVSTLEFFLDLTSMKDFDEDVPTKIYDTSRDYRKALRRSSVLRNLLFAVAPFPYCLLPSGVFASRN